MFYLASSGRLGSDLLGIPRGLAGLLLLLPVLALALLVAVEALLAYGAAQAQEQDLRVAEPGNNDLFPCQI